MNPVLCIATAVVGIAASQAATDSWEMPPVRYSETPSNDPVAKLADQIAKGADIKVGTSPLDRLRHVLKLLEIPEESQMLVFSKTSKQNPLIHPGNPRCLFFNENSYVGYVPGGDIEVIAHDPMLGSVFYLIAAGDGGQTLKITRHNSDCMSCHATARTESAPGVLVRSVFPDQNGQPLFSLGSFLSDHSSPIQERWGGYYVTGRSSLPHLGNRIYQETGDPPSAVASPALTTLADKIDVTKYLRPTSDIVALMVLEHQCKVHDLMVSSAMNYRRIHWLQKSLDPSSDPDAGSAGRQADEAAHRIISQLLFENEADLGPDGIEGDPTFQEAFTRRFPKSDSGRSLADFQLNSRLFKHRCSYMIYSKTFSSLPPRIKSAVIRGLHTILESEPSPENHPTLSTSERRKIAVILEQTLPDWK